MFVDSVDIRRILFLCEDFSGAKNQVLVSSEDNQILLLIGNHVG